MNVYKKIISVILTFAIAISMMMAIPVVSAETTNRGATIEITATCFYEGAFEIVRLVNEVRASVGLGPLKMNPQMMEAAMQRAAELSVYYSHTRPDGSPCFTVNENMFGENIAMGYGGSPAAVMNGWVNSPGHYANIVSENYDSMGAGVVVHNGDCYWVQIFGMSDDEGAATSDEVLEKEFSVNLGNYRYEVDLEAPKKVFVNDTFDVVIMGENYDGYGNFILNNEDFAFETDSPDILSVTNDEIKAIGEGVATITASNSAMTVSATVEISEFSSGRSRQCGDDIFWDYNDGTLTLTGTGRMYDYTTEYDYNGVVNTDVPWTDAFENVRKIVVGEGITYIGNSAFEYFLELEEIELPSTLTGIGEYAFEYCHSLESVTLPENMVELGKGAFNKCYLLVNINIPDGIKIIPIDLFRNCLSLLHINLPESVEIIDSNAFFGCSRLKSVNMPANLKTLEYGVFFGCSSLQEINIPYGVTYISSGTFNGCKALTSVTINNPFLKFGINDMFSGLNDDLTVYGYKNSSAEVHCKNNDIPFVPFDTPTLDVTVKGFSKLYDGKAITDNLAVSFTNTPDEYSVKYSSGESFDFTRNYDSIEALAEAYAIYNRDPYYLIDCDKYPISYCICSEGYEVATGTEYIEIEKLTPEVVLEKAEVEIPYYTDRTNKNTEINTLARTEYFDKYDVEYSSDNEAVAVVDESGYVRVKGIGECTITVTYPGNRNLNSTSGSYKITTYPSGKFKVGDYIVDFSDNKTATLAGYEGTQTSVTLPTEALGYEITGIAHNAFYSSNLETVIIPQGISHIGSSAFLSSLNLKEVTLPDTVETIDKNAFNYCKNLENITIPESVATIMTGAFAGCNNMDSVVIPASVEYIGEKAFGYNMVYFSGDTQKNNDFVIYGHKDTAAERYATENGFKFVDLDAPVPSFELGDVNRDGTVNIKDATAIQKNIAGLISFDEEQNSLADFNEDASVNIKDATAIQKKIAGLI